MIGNINSPFPSVVPGSTVWTNRTVELVKLGHMFIVQKVFPGLAIGANKKFLLNLSNVDAEFLVLYQIEYRITQGKATGTFFEKGNYGGGTPIPIFNRNENSLQAAKSIITVDPSGDTLGLEGQSYIAGGEVQGLNLAGGTVGEVADLPTEVNPAIDRIFQILQAGGSGTFDLSLRLVFAEIPQ